MCEYKQNGIEIDQHAVTLLKGWVEVTGDGLDMIGFHTGKSLRRGTNCRELSVVICNHPMAFQGLLGHSGPYIALCPNYWNCTILALQLPDFQ